MVIICLTLLLNLVEGRRLTAGEIAALVSGLVVGLLLLILILLIILYAFFLVLSNSKFLSPNYRYNLQQMVNVAL